MKKSFGKGHLFEKGNFNWNTIERGTPQGAPLARGARGFAHPEPIGVTPLCWPEPLSDIR